MLKLRYRIPFLAFSSSAFILGVGLNVAQAQHTTLEFSEDHADQAAKWYEEYTNPEHRADIVQYRMLGWEQMRQMDNHLAMKSASNAAWIPVGTSSQNGHVSGRPSCIAFSPAGSSDGNAIYLGEVIGGLWKSTDNGQNWVSLSDSWKTLAVGGVAVDPNHPNVIYAGTGVPNGTIGGGTGVSGLGIYKSTDGGLNWQLLGAGSVGSVTTGMIVNPGNSDIVYQASDAGVYMSTNAGATWTKPCPLADFTSLVMNPLNPAVLYAAAAGQMEKSVDSGKTWKAVTLSSGIAGNLMILAMTPADTNYIYVSSGVSGGAVIARSTNAGASWTKMITASASSASNYLGQQGSYANAIAVNPKNTEDVIVGGLDIYRSTNGGKTLSQKTDWTASTEGSNYTHADIHGLVYNGSTLYSFTDGGIFHSESNGQSWEQDMNKNLGTFLFVGGDAAPDLSLFAAGAQDNGTNTITANAKIWSQPVGGDGGTAFISQTDAQTIYGTYVGGVLHRSTDGGNSWQNNILANSPIQSDNPAFYFEYDVSETDPNVVAVCGSSKIFLTTNSGDDNFPAISKVIGGLGCVAIAKTNTSYIYAGGSSAVSTTTDQGQTWTKSASLGGPVTSISTDPSDENHAYATVAGSKHFSISTDAGLTWAAPANKNLPNLNYRHIAVDQSGQIFIGNDYGVVRSADNGATWYPVGDNFPASLVTSMHIRSHYLVATTYGRGMWYIDLNQLADVRQQPSASNVSNGAASIGAIYPNPVTSTHAQSTIQFSLKEDSHATLSVYDLLGREERVLMNEWATGGQHEQALNLMNLPAGQHYIVLTAGGTSVSQPLTIE